MKIWVVTPMQHWNHVNSDGDNDCDDGVGDDGDDDDGGGGDSDEQTDHT